MSTAGAHRRPDSGLAVRRALAASAVLGGLASAATGAVWTINEPALPVVEAGALPDGPGGPPPSVPPAPVPPAPVPPAAAVATTQATAAARSEAGTTMPLAAPPHRLRMPGVSAPVVPVAVDDRGGLAIPADPGQVGWWVGGAAPGDPAGTVIVAGHVDSARTGRGVLFDLRRVPLDAVVTLDTAAGPRSYRVVARRSADKQRLPADLFARGGAPRLALITCGGAFRDGHYERNVIVYAVPA